MNNTKKLLHKKKVFYCLKFKPHYSGIEWNSLVSRLRRIYIFYEHYKDIFTTRTLGTLTRLRLT